MKYFLTPEFHRNLWLRFSPFRMMAVLIIIALLVWIKVNLHRDSLAESLMEGSLAGYFLIVLVWGNYEAAAAFQNEIKDKTWDFQRMSSLSPWQLAFGKLYGATSFVWYIGVILLAIFVCSYSHYVPHAMPPFMISPDTPKNIMFVTFFLILSGIAGHATAFLVSLSDFSVSRIKLGRLYVPRTFIPFIIGLICSSSIYKVCVSDHFYGYGFYSEYSYSGLSDAVSWFGAPFDARIFSLLSILFFLGWGYLGIYRTARAELMYPQTPLGWVVAVPVIALYLAGFVDMHSTEYLSNLSAFMFFSILFVVYITMLLEGADMEKYRRFFSYLKQKNRRKAFQNMPRWISLLGFLALFYFSTLAFSQETFFATLSLMTAAVLFSVRDGLFVHGIYMASLPWYVRFYLGFYYLLVYYLLPILYFSFAGHQDFANDLMRAFNHTMSGVPQHASPVFPALAYFYPTAMDNLMLAILPVSLEIAAALLWLRRMREKLRAA